MSLCCVYKIFSKNENLNDYYIGSSFDVIKRMRKHKSDVNNVSSVCYNYPLYRCIRDNGGIHNFLVEVLEYFDSNMTWQELKRKEQEWIDKLNPSFNSIRAHNNLDDYKRYRRNYFIKNRTKINNRRHQKNTCGCGGKYTLNNKACHGKTLKHLKWEVRCR